MIFFETLTALLLSKCILSAYFCGSSGKISIMMMMMVTLTISYYAYHNPAPLYKHLFITLPSKQVIVAICCNNPSALWPTVVQVAYLSSRQRTIFTHWHHMTGQSKSLSLSRTVQTKYMATQIKNVSTWHMLHVGMSSIHYHCPHPYLRNHLLLYNSNLIPFTTAKSPVIKLQYNRWAQLHLHFTK